MNSFFENIKAVVLDLDGVILKSNQIKAEAFRELFKDYSTYGDEIVSLHYRRGGMARHEKLNTIITIILGETSDSERLIRLSDEYEEIVKEQMLNCEFADGAFDFIKNASINYELFIASGTPEQELKGLICNRGINHFFTGVFGSPRGKGEILRDILEMRNLLPNQVVFIGDSIDDYIGAQHTGVEFIGIVNNLNENSLNEMTGNIKLLVSNLGKLDAIWKGALFKGD